MNNNENQEQERNKVTKKLYNLVLKNIKAGLDKSVTIQQLIEAGIEKKDVSNVIEEIYNDIMTRAKEEMFEINILFQTLMGGILAALIGGTVWGLVVSLTGYEIGYMATGIGALSGISIVLFAGGKKGMPLQIIAVISSLLGIIIGKYISFFYFLKELIAKKHGVELINAANNMSLITKTAIKYFIDHGFIAMVGGFDVLWIILAIIAAWNIPKSLGIKILS